MFNPTRNQARQLFFDTWYKYGRHEPLSGMETIALEVILQHTEYHPILEDYDQFIDKDYLPEFGETNPFLHMSMHMAIKEQLSINQPVGIQERYRSLVVKLGDEHAAIHNVMDCLGEMLWHAQRDQTTPNAQIYLDCLDKAIRS
ncbi:MAG: DUF1841 family protein [Nitrosomonas sp.]|nr:MAG: DUF1841 family protein [Nitrosomonas sp.]